MIIAQENDWPLQRVIAYAIVLLGTVLIILAPEVVHAAINEDDILEGTLTTFRDRMGGIVDGVGDILLKTFYLLAVMEFTWGMIKNYIDNGGLQGFLSELVTRIMFIGFFLYLFNKGVEIPVAIVESFQTLASKAPGTTTSFKPDDVVDLGQEFLAKSLKVILSGKILSGLMFIFAALVVLISMVILAAHLTVALLEFYVVGYAGFILLAFGASRWTHGYAVSYLKYAMSVGMKLFVIYIIATVVVSEMRIYIAAVDQGSATNAWAIAAFALFSVILAIIAPQSVMGMMSGVSIASGAGAAAAASTVSNTAKGAAGAATGAAAAGAGAVTGTMGVGSAGRAAASLGSAASKAAGGGLGGAGAGAGAVAKSAGSAAMSAMKQAFPVSQSAGGKVAARMNEATKAIKQGE